MRLIRKGNDIGVVWSIYAEQDSSTVAYSLEGRNLSLFLESGKNRYEITDFTVSGNAMSFTFWGKDQIACGAYFLTLVENKGLEDMRVLDYKNAFAIVRHSWEAGGEDNPNITIETVELSSNIGEIIDERLIPNTIARVADVNALLAGYLPLSGGVMGGDVNMNGNYVSGVHAPIEDDDAVNKQYVDSEVGALDNSIQNLSDHISDVESSVGDIQEVIPSSASSSNQLADKAFVNSSIATSTATFRGTSPKLYTESTFLEWANAISSKDANDYVFWWTEDAAGNTVYKRYKYTGSGWLFEYDLNNSSLTADQWAAINSLMTSALTGKLVELPTAQQLAASFNAKQNTLVSGTNIKTINNQSLLGSGNIEIQGGGGASNLVIVEYGVTRYSEVDAEYQAGKTIVAKKSNSAGGYDFYQLVGYNDSALQYDFYLVTDAYVYRLYVVDNAGDTAAEEWDDGETTKLNEKEIFVATYGRTTYSELLDAIWDYNIVICKRTVSDSPRIYTLTKNDVDATIFIFSCVVGQLIYTISLDQSLGWSENNYTLENAANKVTSISSSSTNIQYPSAKAVYDAIQSSKEIFVVSIGVTTHQECWAEYISGKILIGILDESPDIFMFSLSHIDDEQVGFFRFVRVIGDGTIETYTLDGQDNWTSATFSAQAALVSGTNIKTVNSTSLLGSGNIDTTEVFWATYGTTTYPDIIGAHQSGKVILCKHGELLYKVSRASTTVVFEAINDSSPYIKLLTVGTNNTWQESTVPVEITTNKVTSISSSSTDTQYPSAKCVYDLVGDIETLLAAI